MTEGAMTPVHPENPLRQAWLRYQQTESYANTYKWITNEANHTVLEGALWSAFMQGWDAHEWVSGGAGAEDEGAAMSDYNLTEDEVLEEVCRRRGGVSPAIQAVYEKYKHLDAILSDARWLVDDLGGCGDVQLLQRTLYDCWQAIKAHVEERNSHDLYS
jgi:hypothetical protein